MRGAPVLLPIGAPGAGGAAGVAGAGSAAGAAGAGAEVSSFFVQPAKRDTISTPDNSARTKPFIFMFSSPFL